MAVTLEWFRASSLPGSNLHCEQHVKASTGRGVNDRDAPSKDLNDDGSEDNGEVVGFKT